MVGLVVIAAMSLGLSLVAGDFHISFCNSVDKANFCEF